MNNLASLAALDTDIFELITRYSLPRHLIAIVGIKRDNVGSKRVKFDFFPTTATEELLGYAVHLFDGGHDVYFQPTLLKAAPRRGRGKKQNIAGGSVLWVDRDVRQGESHAVVLKKLKDFSPTPTLIVKTGNGYHCYWALNEFVRDLSELESRNNWLRSRLQGDPCWDAAHILRVPGTMNFKDAANPKKVEIVYP